MFCDLTYSTFCSLTLSSETLHYVMQPYATFCDLMLRSATLHTFRNLTLYVLQFNNVLRPYVTIRDLTLCCLMSCATLLELALRPVSTQENKHRIGLFFILYYTHSWMKKVENTTTLYHGIIAKWLDMHFKGEQPLNILYKKYCLSFSSISEGKQDSSSSLPVISCGMAVK